MKLSDAQKAWANFLPVQIIESGEEGYIMDMDTIQTAEYELVHTAHVRLNDGSDVECSPKELALVEEVENESV